VPPSAFPAQHQPGFGIVKLLFHTMFAWLGRPGLLTGRRCGHRLAMAVSLPLAALLSACTTNPWGGPERQHAVYQAERFQPDETFSRLFDAGVEPTCEAARRALLSQGYVIASSEKDSLTARKQFQPAGDVHMEIIFHVVCVPQGASGEVSTAYVSARQDRYVIKKSSTTTSLGVAGVGISLPMSAGEESLVKVGSETIPAGTFYDRYFALMQQLLRELQEPAR
jgi:hypothetical protein